MDDCRVKALGSYPGRQGCDRKGGWPLAPLRTFVHGHIGGLEMPGEARGVEQWRREAVPRELVLGGGE